MLFYQEVILEDLSLMQDERPTTLQRLTTMSIPVARSIGGPAGPPPRTNGTPSGYRNIRVLTPNSLHFRLVAYSALSFCSLNEYILKVLHLATPIDPATGLPVPTSTLETAPGQQPGLDLIEGPGRGAAQTAEETAPGNRSGPEPLDGPGLAARPGASPPPEALAGSRPHQVVDPALSGSIPNLDSAESPPGQDRDGAEPGGQAHA